MDLRFRVRLQNTRLGSGGKPTAGAISWGMARASCHIPAQLVLQRDEAAAKGNEAEGGLGGTLPVGPVHQPRSPSVVRPGT